MKTGIYVDGLGQSLARESVTRYATRLKNEFSYHKTGLKYSLKVEKIKYSDEQESNVVSIIETDGATEKTVYKLYEFKYSDILTGSFKEKNTLAKSARLFNVVIRKIPVFA